MRVRHQISGVEGASSRLNGYGVGEMIVSFADGDGTSDFIRDYDVLLAGEWTPLRAAFRERQVIPDNYNRRFRAAGDAAERTRGHYG